MSGAVVMAARQLLQLSRADLPARGANVCVAMSGGVDSAVTAWALRELGEHRVSAVHMKNWDTNEEDNVPACTQEADFAFVKHVAQRIGIEHVEHVDFSSHYWLDVFQPLLTGLQSAVTPNPDVLCNRRIKFDVFLRDALSRGFDAVVTGHYAQILRPPVTEAQAQSRVASSDGLDDRPRLRRAADLERDQSYFLCGVHGTALRNVHFPIGHLPKTVVREIASLVPALADVADRRSSRGLCFVGKRDFGEFVTQFIEKRPATVVDYESGRVLAQKDNFFAYTVGQRAHVPGLKHRYFVVEKRNETNEVLISANPELLVESECVLEDFHWIAGSPPVALSSGKSMRAREQARSLAKPAALCTVTALDDQCTRLRIQRDAKSTLFSPGQFVALYDEADDICYGGGPVVSKKAR
jgi:tRNA (5-methylaminomethyl-2-thiouridylate)-methyltransferase